MNHSKKFYETTFIVNASLEDSQVESSITHIQEVITRNGGEILAVNKWGRKRLAYAIQKKNNGFYVNIEMQAPGSALSQLERAYQLDENIIRFLTILIDPKALQARQQAAQALAAATAVESQAPAVVQPREVSPLIKEPLFADDSADRSGEKTA